MEIREVLYPPTQNVARHKPSVDVVVVSRRGNAISRSFSNAREKTNKMSTENGCMKIETSATDQQGPGSVVEHVSYYGWE